MLRFVGINDFGNNFYLDNLELNGLNVLGINDEEKISNTIIYPNPSNGVFSIKTNTSNLKIEIYSSIGKLEYSSVIKNGFQQIDLRKKSKGLYAVKFLHNNRIEQRKLILN